MTPEEKRIRKLKKTLTHLSETVVVFSHLLDEEMRKPVPTPEEREAKGRRIAKLLNALENVNDHVLFLELHASIHDKNVKSRIIKRHLKKKPAATEGGK